MATADETTVNAILARLAAIGIVLSVERGRLFADGPAGALTSELRAALTAHRAELLRRLTPPGATTAPAADRFANWIARRGADGRIGWEAPDVPEASRWWARSTFDAPPNWSRRDSL